jgi:hypothetical protein
VKISDEMIDTIVGLSWALVLVSLAVLVLSLAYRVIYA